MIFNINTYKGLLQSMYSHHRNMVFEYRKSMNSVDKFTKIYFHYKNEYDKHLDRCTLLLTLMNCLDNEKDFNTWWKIYNK